MFKGTLYVKYNHNKRRWETQRPFEYITRKDFNVINVQVPAGYSTDLDSVPRIPFVYAWLKGRAIKSAVIHDWLYYNKHDRKDADGIFLKAMKDEGVSLIVRVLIYFAVRLFGWVVYK